MPLNSADSRILETQAFGMAHSVGAVKFGEAVIDQAYAATLAVPTLEYPDTVIVVAALTGNTIVPAPLGARKGMRLTYVFLQDGTGSRTVTWNAVHAAATNGAGTANQVGATSFVYSGTRWVQEGGALTYKA